MFAGLIIVVVLALVGTGNLGTATGTANRDDAISNTQDDVSEPGAQRTQDYIRNLYRENTIAKWVRRLGLIGSIVGGLALAYAIGNQFYSEFGQLPIIGNFYVSSD